MTNRNDPDSLLRQLAAIGQTEPVEIDVRDSVSQTIAAMTSRPISWDAAPLDKTPLVLGGVMVATAASAMLMMMPSLTAFSEPWVQLWLP